MAITFNGTTKIISFNVSTTSVEAIDIYSRWKEWVQLSDNAKFLPAFGNSVGGESLGGGVTTGQYFFIQNGWRIKPFEAHHRLIINGNIFPIPDSASVFAQTVGSFNVTIEMRNSSLTQALSTSGGSGGSGGASAEELITKLEEVGVLESRSPSKKRFTLNVFERMPFPKFNNTWSKEEKEEILAMIRDSNAKLETNISDNEYIKLALNEVTLSIKNQQVFICLELAEKIDKTSMKLKEAISEINFPEMLINEAKNTGDIKTAFNEIKEAFDKLTTLIESKSSQTELSDEDLLKISNIIFDSPLKKYNKFMTLGGLVRKAFE